MTTPQTRQPTRCPAKTIMSDWDDERLARALQDADRIWIDDFIERLNCAVADINRKK